MSGDTLTHEQNHRDVVAKSTKESFAEESFAEKSFSENSFAKKSSSKETFAEPTLEEKSFIECIDGAMNSTGLQRQ